MKYIDNNLEEINESSVDFDIDAHYKKMLAFLNELEIDENTILDIECDSLNYIIEYTDGKEYKVLYNNETFPLKFPSNAAAFACLIEQVQTSKGFSVKPGICLRSKNIRGQLHQFTHESFHTLSTKTDLPYNDEGINYTKCGLEITYYNTNDEVISKDYCATGLNEGVTELLASIFLGDRGSASYEFQVIIAQIITSINKSLFQAYFSRDDTKVINFLDSFEKNQNIITKEELTNMTKNVIFDVDSITKYLKAAIAYDLSHASDELLESEVNKIKEYVKPLDESLDYMLDSGTYVEMVDNIVEEIIGNKKVNHF